MSRKPDIHFTLVFSELFIFNVYIFYYYQGGCTDEKHLKNICAEQATKIEQLTCLVNFYKTYNETT